MSIRDEILRQTETFVFRKHRSKIVVFEVIFSKSTCVHDKISNTLRHILIL